MLEIGRLIRKSQHRPKRNIFPSGGTIHVEIYSNFEALFSINSSNFGTWGTKKNRHVVSHRDISSVVQQKSIYNLFVCLEMSPGAS